MKFRIMEKRGRFRIQGKFRGQWFWRDRCEWASKEYWCLCPDTFDPLIGFRAYEQAEKYIKEHYGLEGVKAIEEPDWRQV